MKEKKEERKGNNKCEMKKNKDGGKQERKKGTQ